MKEECPKCVVKNIVRRLEKSLFDGKNCCFYKKKKYSYFSRILKRSIFSFKFSEKINLYNYELSTMNYQISRKQNCCCNAVLIFFNK